MGQHVLSRILSANRIFRGVVQGFLLARFLPDIHGIGWSTLAMGSLLSGGLLADFLLTLVMGHWSDRIPPWKILMLGESISALSAFLFLLDPGVGPLMIATVLAGLGQRSNGSPGPYAPAEQVLLARMVPPESRFSTFGRNTAMGLSGMVLGALLGSGAIRVEIASPLPNLKAAMLALLFLSALNIMLLVVLSRSSGTAFLPKGQGERTGRTLSPVEKKRLSLLVASNLFGGLALGLTEPIIAYWFLIRFQTSPAHVALLLAFSYLLSALLAFYLSLHDHPGRLIGSVVVLQVLSLLSLALLTLASSLVPAFLLYSLRLGLVRAPGGVRQAMAGAIVDPAHTGWAASLHLSSLQGAQILGPVLAGTFWNHHWTNGPLFLAEIMTGASLVLFLVLFRGLPTHPFKEGVTWFSRRPISTKGSCKG